METFQNTYVDEQWLYLSDSGQFDHCLNDESMCSPSF